MITRDDALALFMKHNTEKFHIRHALTVEAVMRWFAADSGHDGEADKWGIVGLLHDIDFGKYPNEHCVKAKELLKEAKVEDELIRAVCSHGYGFVSDVKPESDMEKTLFAIDELTGLIGAAALLRPSKSVADMEVSSLKKKFKDKKFAAGCSRDVIVRGSEMLGWELDKLFEKGIQAMRSCENAIEDELAEIFEKVEH